MLYVAGQKLESVGRLEEARGAYRRALEATTQPQPQKSVDHRVKASKLSHELSRTPDVDMTRATLLYHLAHAFLLEADHEAEAVECAKQAVELSPHSGTLTTVLIEMRCPLKRCSTGIIALTRLPSLITLLLRCCAGKAWQILGLAHERLGTADAAVRCYRRGTREEPRVVGNHYNLALLLGQAGHWQASLAAANGGLAAVPVSCQL